MKATFEHAYLLVKIPHHKIHEIQHAIMQSVPDLQLYPGMCSSTGGIGDIKLSV